MKILELNDLSGVPQVYTKYFKKLGHNTVFVPQNITGEKVKNLESFDIVHAHYAITASTIKMAMRRKIVLHLHGSDARNLKMKYKPILKFLKMRSELILCATPDLAIHTNGIWIPNPIDVEKFKPMQSKKYDNRILVFSAKHKIKRWDILLKVIESLPQYQFDTPYNIEGNIPKNLNLIGKVPYEKVPELLRKYKIVLGQMSGYLGMNDLESMACKIPIVVYVSDTILSYYGYENPSIDTSDYKTVAKTVKKLMSDKKARNNLADKQFKFVRKYHDPYKICKHLIRLFESIK